MSKFIFSIAVLLLISINCFGDDFSNRGMYITHKIYRLICYNNSNFDDEILTSQNKYPIFCSANSSCIYNYYDAVKNKKGDIDIVEGKMVNGKFIWLNKSGGLTVFCELMYQ